MNYSCKGKILISTPDISGDIFSRSVVLVVEHNDNGAFGLILNKKNDQASQKLLHLFGFPVDVYDGGPVENFKTFFIVNGLKVSEISVEINENYHLTEDQDSVIEALSSGKLLQENVKIFSGYSGWAALQLETELKAKMWTIVEVYNLDYTSPNDQNLWKNIMQNLGGEYLLWANAPEDVSMN
ncbi:YqgE/AlgH family protein [Halpernia frigidisoli]|uniref:Putative transcriptional regulator n=1 Tax=Halpernia frigidisoli TaxID=1125876 RepID=A0A1I3FR70_9FLAO|nr:YqgE/AlgH family protein [Halpernia frigidisoli]SFI13706.1 putative transcriptional regulator [Halpernia frigidisoli]